MAQVLELNVPVPNHKTQPGRRGTRIIGEQVQQPGAVGVVAQLGQGPLVLQAALHLGEARRQVLEDELERAKAPDYEPQLFDTGGGVWSGYAGGRDAEVERAATGLQKDALEALLEAQGRVPDDFTPHKKIENLLEGRREMARGEKPLDWGAGEALAFASLLAQGHRVRLAGQDSGRGTFSHRHAVLHDFETGGLYLPLAHLPAVLDQPPAPFEVWDSPLSEIGPMAFEYGYSLDTPDGLICWEAQFGDFANVAQIIIDQFISSSEDKWNRLNSLVLLLPHGFEGQGPEHSSARLERFLNLCADDNMQVVNLTTPAQLFHCLRRQVVRPLRKPLVVMSPKSLLRHKRAVSSLVELADGAFQRVIPDATDGPVTDPSQVRRILLTSGKLFYELETAREKKQASDIALVRLEQYYPLPLPELIEALGSYPEGTPVTWVQEEPENMGARSFLLSHLGGAVDGRWPLSFLSRRASSSPATGSLAAHKQEQQELIDNALA